MVKKNRFIITLFSIFMGLVVGAIILLVAGYNPIQAYKIMIEGVISNPKYISWTVIRATPIILTGISVAFAFRTGLFNIGAEGQYMIGTIFATLVGYYLNLPPVLHAIFAILAGALAAGLWGGFIGLVKSKFGVHEVITSIMLNWIALYANNWVVNWSSFRRPNSDSSYKILESAKIGILSKWKGSETGRAFLKDNNFVKDLLNPPVNWGFIIAIFVAILIWYILKNTTLGYQLKAVGYNKDAAEFGGIDVKKNMIKSMAIAGAISGLAGALQTTGVSNQLSILAASEGYGFDGISVALIAANNPLATIPAGLLFSGLKYGGSKLNSTIGAPSEIINITIGVIVFFIAMPKLLEIIGNITKGKKRGANNE